MKKIYLILLLKIFLIDSNFILGNSPSIKIQISPPIYEREVRQGENLSFEISLKNNSSKPVELKGYAQTFQMTENGKPIFIDDPYLPFSCQSWIDIKPKSFHIKPGEIKVVSISINVPQEAKGGNYASVLFDIETNESVPEGNQVGLTIRTGTLILLSVRNTTKLDAEIESFKITQQPGKSIFEVLLTNNSNSHLKPSGNITIFMDNNKVIDRIYFKENTFIMPQSKRLFRFVWEDSKKRKLKNSYEAECRFQIKGLGKSLIERKEFVITH